MLGSRGKKASDVAAAGKMFTNRSQDDNAHPRIGVERLEGQAQLVALWHRDHVERRPVKDDVGTLACGV